MAEAPTYSLAQVIALAKGTTNWYEYAKSVAQHGKNNQDDVSALSGGGAPGWQAAIDLRWYVADTSSSTTTYAGVTKPSATGSDALFAGYFIIFKPANNNTGASTLNVASSNGAVNIKKISSGAKAALAANDLDSDTYAELIFDGTDWIMLNAPVIADLVADTSPQLGGDLDCNGAQIQWSQGADVASATALAVLTDGNYFDVTGTTTITSINTTGGVGTLIKLHFDGALTLTHDATDLILPGGANITTAAGDEAEFIEYATGDYRCTNYSRTSGEAVAGGKILQVVSATSASSSSTTSTSFVTSNLTADITPADATNKVLVLIQTVGRMNPSGSMYYTLYEDGVNIGHSTKGMGKIYTAAPEALNVDVPISIIHLASPVSASAVTYTLYYGIVSSGSTAECPPDDDMIQNITLMEIAV